MSINEKELQEAKQDFLSFITEIEQFKKNNDLSNDELVLFIETHMKKEKNQLISDYHVAFDHLDVSNQIKQDILIGLNHIGISIPRKIVEMSDEIDEMSDNEIVEKGADIEEDIEEDMEEDMEEDIDSVDELYSNLKSLIIKENDERVSLMNEIIY